MKAGMRLIVAAMGCFVLFASPAPAAYYFIADGGTFVTLSLNGSSQTYQLGYSSTGEPQLDGANLGTFSLADGNTLYLAGFANTTVESGGHAIFAGKLHSRIQPAGAAGGTFSTNISTHWTDLGGGMERHYATNTGVNLLAGLTGGVYELEVYAAAQGNFSPDLLEDNGGSNFVAAFIVTEDPLPPPETAVTENGKVIQSFTYTTNAGFGSELFVVGNHPDLGSWNPVMARKLQWSEGNVWTGQVAIEAGHALEYKFIVRTNSFDGYCDAGNAIWQEGANLATNIPAGPAAPFSSKSIWYRSGWTNVNLIWQSGLNTNWYSTSMTQVSTGRVAGEFLYHAGGIGAPGEKLTFVPNGSLGGVEDWDHSPATGGDYFTVLDAFMLQDGQIYNYWPPASVSVSRIIVTNCGSSFPEIPGRTVQIYLPRGYDQNTWKKYPVLYMHDGQNVFEPGGAFGTWAAETNADHMTSLGMMRETIIAAVDNTTNRIHEYLPPYDSDDSRPGIADQYANFLIHNVRPMVDYNFRTLNDRDNTLTLGSSCGGVVSFYLGLETNVFGKIGPMSTAIWISPVLKGRMETNDTSGLRIYTDMGTDESSSMWTDHAEVYDILLRDGYVVNDTLRSEIGCGHAHSEWAWDVRLPMAYEFLLNINDEPNRLLQRDHPPAAAAPDLMGSVFSLSTPTLKGHRYSMESSASLVSPAWTGVYTSAVETLLWSTRTLTDTSAAGDLRYYRIAAEAAE